MSSLLAVDPGTKCVGWALWGDEGLERCGLARTKQKELGARAYDLAQQLPRGDFHVVVEKPRLYPRSRKLQPNDLIDLAFVGGMCGLSGTSTSVVEPVRWKGQTPKHVCHERVMKSLSYPEIFVVKEGISKVPKSLRHNVLDAIGIGFWYRNG